MNSRNGAAAPQSGRFQWGSYGFFAGVVVGLLMGWMFHGFVGAFIRITIAAVVIVPLILLFLAWRKYFSPLLRPPAQADYSVPAGAIETRAVVRQVVHEPHAR